MGDVRDDGRRLVVLVRPQCDLATRARATREHGEEGGSGDDAAQDEAGKEGAHGMLHRMKRIAAMRARQPTMRRART
jgi:hypothetical protein